MFGLSQSAPRFKLDVALVASWHAPPSLFSLPVSRPTGPDTHTQQDHYNLVHMKDTGRGAAAEIHYMDDGNEFQKMVRLLHDLRLQSSCKHSSRRAEFTARAGRTQTASYYGAARACLLRPASSSMGGPQMHAPSLPKACCFATPASVFSWIFLWCRVKRRARAEILRALQP